MHPLLLLPGDVPGERDLCESTIIRKAHPSIIESLIGIVRDGRIDPAISFVVCYVWKYTLRISLEWERGKRRGKRGVKKVTKGGKMLQFGKI